MKTKLFPDEIVFIRKNYDTMIYDDILEYLNKFRNVTNQLSYPTLRHRFRDLGLYRYKLKLWNKSQTKYLLKNWKTKGNTEMANHLSSGKFYGKKNITADKVRKKMELLNLHRTPKELSAVVKRNIKLGLTTVNKPGQAVVKGNPERHRTIWDHNGTKYNFIKIDGAYIMYGKWNYEQKVGKVPKGFILFRIDMDSLNDELDNLKIKKRGGISLKEMNIALDLTKLRISHLKIDLSGLGNGYNGSKQREKQRAIVLYELRRLTRHKASIISKINKKNKTKKQ